MTPALTNASTFVTFIPASMKQQKPLIEGKVVENLPNTFFRVLLDDGREILAHLSGKMRMYYIKVLPGDRVRVEMTLYDASKGRIVQRLK